MDKAHWFTRRGLTLAGVGLGLALLVLQWTRLASLVRKAEPVATAHGSELPAARGLRAEGRLVTYPGGDVIVGTDLGGTLKSLRVFEKMHVKKGELIAEIDASVERAALVEASARVAEATVDSRFFDLEHGRSTRLLASGAIPPQALDQSVHARDAALARAREAAGTVGRLRAIVNKARIFAPIDGIVVERRVEPGETLAPAAQLVRIADLSRTRIEAEVAEYDAGQVALGQSVSFFAEGSPGVAWKGHVEEIPDTVTARRLKPQDPGRPADTRVLLVKIALEQPVPIKLGQRVEVEILAPRSR